MIKTGNSDAFVIALFAFSRTPEVEELWIEYGAEKYIQYLPIHELHSKLPSGVPELIPFFHAFTGCDALSSVCGIGKKLRGRHGCHFVMLIQFSRNIQTSQQ